MFMESKKLILEDGECLVIGLVYSQTLYPLWDCKRVDLSFRNSCCILIAQQALLLLLLLLLGLILGQTCICFQPFSSV